MERPLGYNVNLATQQLSEVKKQRRVVQETSSLFHLDQKVNVTVRPGITAGNRTEHAHVSSTVFPSDCEDFVPSGPKQVGRGAVRRHGRG